MKPEMYAHIREIEQRHWWYVARRRIIFGYALTMAGASCLSRVLDVGCGTGLNLHLLHQKGYQRAVGLDLSVEALTFCQSRGIGSLVRADAASMPVECGVFDLIMALDVLEHLPDDAQGLREFARLLAPGGALIAFAPAFEFLWGLQDEVSEHERRYTAAELRKQVEAAGLEVDKLTYCNFFLFPLIYAARLMLGLFGSNPTVVSENELHPNWSNRLLQGLFSAEHHLLPRLDLPVGVSLLCVARKPRHVELSL